MSRTFRLVFVNAITCLRFPLALVVAYLFWRGEPLLAAGCVAFGLVTDWVDGPLARALDATTDFGREKLEPWADTALMTGTLLGLGLGGFIPAWLLGAMAAGHVVIELGIKPRVKRPSRIIFFQAVAMEVGMPLIIMLILMGVDWRLAFAAPVVGIAVAALKRRRIREFTAWCFRE